MNTPPLLESFIMICLISAIDTVSQIFFKNAVNKSEIKAHGVRGVLQLGWAMLRNFKMWLGMWIGLAGLALWAVVLSRTDINLAFSLSSVHFIFIAIGAKLFLKEPLTPGRWVGTLMIALGIAIISFT